MTSNPEITRTNLSFISDTLMPEKGNLSAFDDYDSRRQQIFDYAKTAGQIW